MQQRVRRSPKRAPAEKRSRQHAPSRTGETAQERQEGIAEQEQCRSHGQQQHVLYHVRAQQPVRCLVQRGGDRNPQTRESAQEGSNV